MLDTISRKLRSSFTRLGTEIGKTDWFEVFDCYDTDGDGGIDLEEFINAVRKEAKIDDTRITDRELKEVFSCVDTGDGMISPEEFRVFLAVKKDMRRLAKSGKMADPVEAGEGKYTSSPALACDMLAFLTDCLWFQWWSIRSTRTASKARQARTLSSTATLPRGLSSVCFAPLNGCVLYRSGTA